MTQQWNGTMIMPPDKSTTVLDGNSTSRMISSRTPDKLEKLLTISPNWVCQLTKWMTDQMLLSLPKTVKTTNSTQVLMLELRRIFTMTQIPDN
jgi:hypothetical protein